MLVDLCRSRAATSGAPGSWSRGAICFDYAAKVAYWNPNIDLDAALESLPEGVELAALEEHIKPIISRVDGVRRIEGQRRD